MAVATEQKLIRRVVLPRERRSTARGWRMVDDDEGRVIFDQHARKELGISGEEFLRRYDAGEYQGLTDPADYHKINRLVMMMPLVRPVPA